MHVQITYSPQIHALMQTDEIDRRYHAACHNMLHEQSREVLMELYKTSVFTIQAEYFLKTGNYLRRKAELFPKLNGLDREILYIAIEMKQKSGNIINMASVVGVSGNAGQANYSASKAGLIGLAKSIAKELGSRGIRANAIAPGFIITDMTAQLSQEVRDEWAQKIPLRRGGTPEDVANAALFLASDLSGYVSGQTIHVCGGMNT